MPSLRRLLAFAILTLSANAATLQVRQDSVVPPASMGQAYDANDSANLNGTQTDSVQIQDTVNLVNQKSGADANATPNMAVNQTTVTAVDGQVVQNGTTVSQVTGGSGSSRRSIAKRQDDGFYEVFSGTGVAGGPQMDAAIEGTAYLTYTVVSNSTYDINDCLSWCLTLENCVFVNLYYEFNNYLLDFVFSQQSNLKCVAYGDVHTAVEKTNFGGQQSYPAPAPLTYIQDSSGWALPSALVNPDTPDGYEYVFGPTEGANEANGYMGFTFIDNYDVDACAALCNARDPDPNGGACQYFNIWRALVNGVPTTYTCAFYYIPTDESTAINYGQGDLQVTFSRGYSRIDCAIDGGFEGYGCSSNFCFSASYANWIGTSPPGGYLDASVFYYVPYAHSGHGSGLLGASYGTDRLSGTLSAAQPLATVAGTQYIVTLFVNSAFSGPWSEAAAFVDVLWNGATVGTISGYSEWTYYQFDVTGTGNDLLSFFGGAAPAWTFIDDVHVFIA